MPRNYNLLLAAIWLCLAIVLLAPEDAIAPKLAKNLGGPLKLPVAILAVVLTVYNLVRWWSYRSLARSRDGAANPLAQRPESESREYERNPELDFFKRDGDAGEK